ncbi:hypothetical protein FRC19_009271 [Serendipita sp. 401]|nr:hypothetical protein FRC19_009271 [Serendipita sp. 401]KAG8879485.1 hypothetical protein FRC20_000057 [Serendipita sp. 405]
MDKLEPRDDEPLGIPFPGICSTEPGTPNWVGHLITEYAPSSHQILVYNYAMLGSTVPEVTLQIDRHFLGDNGPTARKVPWTAENSLFITWVGLNDLAISTDPEEPIEEFFRGQEKLYAAGARNFLFINVPPIDRSPACTLLEMYGVVDDDREASIRRAATRFVNWNIFLAAGARRFASPSAVPLTPTYSPELMSDPNVRPPVAVAEAQEHTGASVMLFSSYECISMILNNPTAFGLAEADLRKVGGSIWVDHMHPTSVVHDLFARDLSRFLSKI